MFSKTLLWREANPDTEDDKMARKIREKKQRRRQSEARRRWKDWQDATREKYLWKNSNAVHNTPGRTGATQTRQNSSPICPPFLDRCSCASLESWLLYEGSIWKSTQDRHFWSGCNGFPFSFFVLALRTAPSSAIRRMIIFSLTKVYWSLSQIHWEQQWYLPTLIYPLKKGKMSCGVARFNLPGMRHVPSLMEHCILLMSTQWSCH